MDGAATITADWFPAAVSAPDGTVVRDVRVLVVGGRALLFGRDGATPRFVSAVEDVEDVTLGRRTMTLSIADGSRWTVTRLAGCGCGNPLKRATQSSLLGLVG